MVGIVIAAVDEWYAVHICRSRTPSAEQAHAHGRVWNSTAAVGIPAGNGLAFGFHGGNHCLYETA